MENFIYELKLVFKAQQKLDNESRLNQQWIYYTEN